MGTTKIPKVLIGLAPFYHDVILGPGESTSPGNPRMRYALDMFFPPLLASCGGSFAGKRILDLGCNCGGFSIAALRLGAKEVVGIDSRSKHVKQANAIIDYLGLSGANFYEDRIENVDESNYGRFDILFAFGVLYHLSDPISIFQKISLMVDQSIIVDSHVHFSSDTQQEDIPSWWMLADTDIGDLDGLHLNDGVLNINKYLDFERSTPVDYSLLGNQAILSPHSARDLEFIGSMSSDHSSSNMTEIEDLAAADLGSLVMVPNKKALVKLIRYSGFNDVLEIIPHRFAPEPYIRKYRIGLIGSKRRKIEA